MALGRSGIARSLESILDQDASATLQGGEYAAAAERVTPQPGQGLEFENLSYSVVTKQKKGGQWVARETYLLHDISGQALRGHVTAILGPSGAGKSTFVDALAGRIARGSLEGSVCVDGRPVSSCTQHSCLTSVEHVGYILSHAGELELYVRSCVCVWWLCR